MTTPLTEALHRIADDAPTIAVSPDTWSRARSARRRDRGLVGLGTAGLVAAAVAAALLVPGSTADVEPAGGTALPSRIRALEPVPTSDLAVGVSSVAYLSATGTPVVVDADGSYHGLELPSYVGDASAGARLADLDAPIALSPDGTRLAYGWADVSERTRKDQPTTAIAVVDLTTGSITTTPITLRQQSIAVTRLVWSSTSDGLVYVGTAASEWTPSAFVAAGTTSGLLRPDASVAVHFANPTGSTQLALLSNQVVVVATDDGADAFLRLTRGAEGAKDPIRPTSRLTDAGPDEPLIGACGSGFAMTAVRREPDGSVSTRRYDTRGQGVETDEPYFPQAFNDRPLVVLGCVAVDQELGSPEQADSVILVRSGSELGVVTVGSAHYTRIGTVDGAVSGLSVATDLI